MRAGMETKRSLASEFGVSPRQVEVWFQNKRARARKRNLSTQEAEAVERRSRPEPDRRCRPPRREDAPRGSVR